MHSRRATTDDYPIESILDNSLANGRLPRITAGVSVLINEGYHGHLPGCLKHLGDVHCASDISPAVTNKDSDSSHNPSL